MSSLRAPNMGDTPTGDIERDEYVQMEPNPRHLSITHDSGGASISDLSHIYQTIDEAQTTAQSAKATSTAKESNLNEDADYIACVNSMYLHYNNEGTLATTLNKLNMNKQLKPTVDWLTNCINTIKSTFNEYPIRTKNEVNLASTDLENLKALGKNIENIPPKLHDLMPDQNRQKIEDILNEDLLSVASFCYKRINKIKSNLKIYDVALKRLENRKKTRLVELMLKGIEPVPLDLYDDPNPEKEKGYKDNCPTRNYSNDCYLEPIRLNIPHVGTTSNISNIDDVVHNTGVTQLTTQSGLLMLANMGSISGSNVYGGQLTPITESSQETLINEENSTGDDIPSLEHDLANLEIRPNVVTSDTRNDSSDNPQSTNNESQITPQPVEEAHTLNLNPGNMVLNERMPINQAHPSEHTRQTRQSSAIIIEDQDPLQDDQRQYMITLIKDIVGHDEKEEAEINNSADALKLLYEKLGITLDIHDPNIIDNVEAIYESKVMFKTILSMRQGPPKLPPKPSNPITQVPSQIQMQTNPIYSPNDSVQEFYTPETSNMSINYTTYHSAPSTMTSFSVQLASPPVYDQHTTNAQNQTPKPLGILKRTNIMQSMNNDSQNPMTTRARVGFNENQLPQGMGPELNSETSIEDLQRHERALLQPSVRSRINQTNVENIIPESVIDLSHLYTMSLDDQKQYLGEHIYLLVKKEVPSKAKKITGMILDLPNDDIVRGILDKKVLKSWIDKSITTLNEYDQQTSSTTKPKQGDGILTITERNEPLTENQPTIKTNLKNTQSPHNDHHTAMFQEIGQNTMQQAFIYPPPGNQIYNAPSVIEQSNNQTRTRDNFQIPQTPMGFEMGQTNHPFQNVLPILSQQPYTDSYGVPTIAYSQQDNYSLPIMSPNHPTRITTPTYVNIGSHFNPYSSVSNYNPHNMSMNHTELDLTQSQAGTRLQSNPSEQRRSIINPTSIPSQDTVVSSHFRPNLHQFNPHSCDTGLVLNRQPHNGIQLPPIPSTIQSTGVTSQLQQQIPYSFGAGLDLNRQTHHGMQVPQIPTPIQQYPTDYTRTIFSPTMLQSSRAQDTVTPQFQQNIEQFTPYSTGMTASQNRQTPHRLQRPQIITPHNPTDYRRTIVSPTNLPFGETQQNVASSYYVPNTIQFNPLLFGARNNLNRHTPHGAPTMLSHYTHPGNQRHAPPNPLPPVGNFPFTPRQMMTTMGNQYAHTYTPSRHVHTNAPSSVQSGLRPTGHDPHFSVNNPAVIQLVLRERKELCSTSFLVQREVGQLSQANQMNGQELTDLLTNMKGFGRSLEKLENKVSKFLKYLIENKSIIDQYDPNLYGEMKGEIDEAEQLSSIFQQRLNEADLIIRSEKITISQMNSHDSKELPYKEFNAGRNMLDAHIYEFLSTLEMNFRICRTPTNIRPQMLKKLLKGSAKLAIPEDLNDYQRIVDILLTKFGNPILILSNILELHHGIGKIPSKCCQRPPWQKIEDTCKNHLFLIRKAEALSSNQVAYPQIFESSYRNFHLINLISHEWNDDLKNLQHSTDVGNMYRLIVRRFEEILSSSSSNIDHSETKQKKDNQDPKKHEDKFELDQYALAYGERKQQDISVGRCQPQDCQFCVTFQRLGTGKDYFEKHLLYGQSKKQYVNNCPNYLALSMEEKNNFINANNFCQYCLRFKSLCKNQACGEDHLIPYLNGKQKTYVCQEESCKNRIELCLLHRVNNRETLEMKKRNFKEKYQIDFTVALFTAMNTPVHYNFNNCTGSINNTIFQENRAETDANDITYNDDTASFLENVDGWLDKVDTESTSSYDATLNNKITKVTMDDTTNPTPETVSKINTKNTNGKLPNITSEYEAFKRAKGKELHHPIKNPVLLLPQASQNDFNQTTNHQLDDDFDKPLLAESTNQLLQSGAKLFAEDCKSIFIYSKIQGLTRPLSCLFDSGGGSSLSLHNVPGRQLPAAKGKGKPVLLQGIGSGTTRGEQYTVLLPLIKGGNVGVEIYSVPEILQPMSKVDLEPALTFFKASSKADPDMNEGLKNEIAKASIFRFVQGSLDLLLGVKLFGLFPTLIHTLECGLSIFKMKIKPSSSKALYCLGGPYQSLSSLQGLFPDGAIMLQEIDTGLNAWRESSKSITEQHLPMDLTPQTIYDLDHGPIDKHDIQNSNDDIIMSIQEQPSQSNTVQDTQANMSPICKQTCLDLLDNFSSNMQENSLQRAIKNHNEHQEQLIETDYLREMNNILIRFTHHIIECMKNTDDYNPEYKLEAKQLRLKMGYLFRRCPTAFDTEDDIAFLKNAICHLEKCIHKNEINTKQDRPNFFIALDCDQFFTDELSDFQNFFLESYPELRGSMTPTTTAHITLLAFRLPSHQDLECAGIAFTSAWNQWLGQHPAMSTMESMGVNFQGIGNFDGKVLYLKPDLGMKGLISLNKELLTTFKKFGFDCDERFTPHLTFSKLPFNTSKVFPDGIIERFSDIKVGHTRFTTIKMFSMKKDKATKLNQCYKTLTFNEDLTWPKSVTDYVINQTELPLMEDYEENCCKTIKQNEPLSLVQPHANAFLSPQSPILMFEDEDNIQLDLDSDDDKVYQQNEIISGFNPVFTDDDKPDKDHETALVNTNNKEYKDLVKDLKLVFDSHTPEPRCPTCISCKTCKSLSMITNNNTSAIEHREEFIIKSSVYFDEEQGKFCSPLPLKEDPAVSLAPNSEESKQKYYRIIKSLEKKPEDKGAILESLNKLIELGHVQKLSDMDEETQQNIMKKQLYVIPWNVVYKSSSVTTPCRIVLNGSSKTRTGKSLNNILCKGIPRLNLLPLVLILTADPILVTLDLQKFFNSCLIPKSQYHLQCIWWETSLDPNVEPEIYIIKTHTYGMSSSSRILEVCLEMVAEMNSDNEDVFNLLTKKLYVDDGFANCKDEDHAYSLRNDTDTILNKNGFKVKGFAQSYQEPPQNISEEHNGQRSVGVIGMIWIPNIDVLRFRLPPLDFKGKKLRGKLESADIFSGNTYESLNNFVPTNLTLRTVASKCASFWDPPGLAEPWFLGAKHILRLSSEAVTRRWDTPLPDDLRDLWVEKFWEMHLLSKVDFPRCTLPLGVNYTELDVVGLSDYGGIGKLQCFYSLKKMGKSQYHVQLIYSKSQLSHKMKSVPCQELDSASTSATILDKICLALGNVNRRALMIDSTICAYWLMKDPLKLALYQRFRVQNILRFCTANDIFHIRSEWNSSDVGTKRPEPISCIMPGSFFSSGPAILKMGLEECEQKSLIKRISNVILDPSVKNVALDGIAYRDMPPDYLALGFLPESDIIHHRIVDEITSDEEIDNTLLIAHTYEDTMEHVDNSHNADNISTGYGNLNQTHHSKTPDQDMNRAVMVINPLFVKKVGERFAYHNYLVNPLERPWSISVRIMSIVLHFISKTTQKRIEKSAPTKKLGRWQKLYDNLFLRQNEPTLTESFTNLCFHNQPIQSNTQKETSVSILSSPLPEPILSAHTSRDNKAGVVHSQPNPMSNLGLSIPVESTSIINNPNLSLKESNNHLINVNIKSSSKTSDVFRLKNMTRPLRIVELFHDIESMKLAREAAIYYFLKLASDELEHFYTKSMIKKHALKRGNIFYSKQRLLEVDNIECLMGEKVNTRELGIQNELPCSDRYSPVAISILVHFHRKICNHQGVDRTWLATLSSLYVFQGQTCLNDIIRSCFHCRIKLMKKFKTIFGPINKFSLTFAAVNKHIMLDLSGPYLVRTRFNAKSTRNNPNTTKVYLLHSICLTSFLNCIVIVEDYGSEAFTDSLHRIGSRYGYPSVAWTDASRAQLKSLIGTKLTLNSLLGDVFQETGIEIRVSGAGFESHSRQGRIEKAIHCFQMFLQNRKVNIENLTILQLDSLVSQAAAFLNSMPLCHRKRTGTTVSSALISPFSFLLGRRSNCRAPAGYPQVAQSRSNILEGVEDASDGMFSFFTAQIPDLLLRPAKHDESKESIQTGDLVLFPYELTPLSKHYKLGLVTNLELDADQKSRIVEVAYTLSQEQHLPINHKDRIELKRKCRFTRRGVHTLVKIYSVSDPDINKDIDHLNSQLRKGVIHQSRYPTEGAYATMTNADCNKKTTDVSVPASDESWNIGQDEDTPLTPDISFEMFISQMGYLIHNQ